MKKLLFSIFFASLCSLSVFADRGDLVSDSLVSNQFNQATIGAVYDLIPGLIAEQVPCADWNLPGTYGVEMYKLVYETINSDGDPTIASGLVGIPMGNTCNMAMINYNHGTQNDGALSEPGELADLLNGDLAEWFICVPIAAAGYIAVMPDYIGYGESACTDFHAYNNYSEAKDVVDMIRATKQFCDNQGISYSNELFVTGYSEGGLVAMATTKEIQENHCEEMQITASAPLSGAHSIYPLTRDSIFSPTYENITNLTYFIYSSHNICPDILGEEGIAVAVLPEYVDAINAAWDECGDGQVEDYADLWPTIAADILIPEFAAEIASNECHPFNEYIRRSNVNNWVPNVPMRLYYVESDEQVPYTNSTTTAAWMAANGADVEALTVEACDGIIHSAFAIPALIETMNWFIGITNGDCDYVAEVDPNWCSTGESFNNCPSEGESSSEFINFAIVDGEVLFEELAYNDNCEILVDVIVGASSTQEVTVYLTDGEVFSVDTTTTTIYDTIPVETPVTTDYVVSYTVIDTSQLMVVFDTLDITGIESNLIQGIEVDLQNNPIANYLRLDIRNQTEIQSINVAIYNINGQQLINEEVQLFEATQYQKEVSNLPSGMYLLQAQLPNGVQQTLRFVKE